MKKTNTPAPRSQWRVYVAGFKPAGIRMPVEVLSQLIDGCHFVLIDRPRGTRIGERLGAAQLTDMASLNERPRLLANDVAPLRVIGFEHNGKIALVERYSLFEESES